MLGILFRPPESTLSALPVLRRPEHMAHVGAGHVLYGAATHPGSKANPDDQFRAALDGKFRRGESTQRLQCSPCLFMTYFPLRGYKILPKTELHWSIWV